MNNTEFHKIKNLIDDRGELNFFENNEIENFEIKRIYYIHNNTNNSPRGFHAHKNLKQLAICLKGSCKFILDDGKKRVETLLSNPSEGLFIDKMIWREMYDFSADCILLVLANMHHDEEDYIRDYEKFCESVNEIK